MDSCLLEDIFHLRVIVRLLFRLLTRKKLSEGVNVLVRDTSKLLLEEILLK